MPKRVVRRKPASSRLGVVRSVAQYDSMLTGVVELLELARRTSARAVNAIMTATYWEIGRRIVEVEQQGQVRAGYGDELLKQLSADLTGQFGRGFSRQNLGRFRSFFLAYSQVEQIRSTPWSKSGGTPMSDGAPLSRLQPIAARFPLPWCHYRQLLSVKNPLARQFYEAEALRGGWSVRQLDRQINTQFYERTALSKNKKAMLTKGQKSKLQDSVTANDEIRDPLLLEFLDLKDEYSESDLEEALIQHLETFLMELGGDFAFVGRQRRLRIGDEWFRVDLVLFHRVLRCLVIVDLKLGKFTHADSGQMQVYLNYAREHWTRAGENPPVGLILCTTKNDALAQYALGDLTDRVLIREYQTTLPNEQLLADEIERTRQWLESRRSIGRAKEPE